jgi:hypothetical protein
LNGICSFGQLRRNPVFIRLLHSHCEGTGSQSFEMMVEFKQSTVIGAKGLKDCPAKEQTFVIRIEFYAAILDPDSVAQYDPRHDAYTAQEVRGSSTSMRNPSGAGHRLILNFSSSATKAPGGMASQMFSLPIRSLATVT